MSGFLVDTNVISEFTKPQPDSRVTRWLEVTDPQLLFASVVTVGEIRLGIEDLPLSNGARLWRNGWNRAYRNGSNLTFCR